MREGNARKDELPVRPSLPLTFFCSVCIWLACIGVGEIFISCMQASGTEDGDVIVWCLVVVAIAVLLTVGLIYRKTRPLCVVCAIGLVFGSLSTGLHCFETSWKAQEILGSSLSNVVFTVEGDPRQTKTGNWYFQAKAEIEDGDGRAVGATVFVDSSVLEYLDAPKLGDKVVLTGTWGLVDASDGYGRSQFLQGRPLKVSARGIDVRGQEEGPLGLIREFRGSLSESIQPLDSSAAALVAGVVCGNQAAVAYTSLTDAFSQLGISHLVAVSGSHLAVIAGLVLAASARMHLTPKQRILPISVVLLAYVCFTGVQISAVRSFVMAFVALLGSVMGRRSQGGATLGLTVMVLLLSDPGCAWSLGFQLSVLSVFALTMFAGYVRAWIALGLPRATPRAVVDCLSITTVSVLATLPIVLPTFGQISVIAPLSNFLIGPLVSVILLTGIVLIPIVTVIPAFSVLLIIPMGLAEIAVVLAKWLCCFPYCSLSFDVHPLVVGFVCVVGFSFVYLLWPRPSRQAFAVLATCVTVAVFLFILRWRYFVPARVVVMDVGQGDAILVQDGSATILIDVGPDSSVVDALTRLNVFHIDAVVLTHTDSDHSGGMPYLQGKYAVQTAIVAAGVPAALTQASNDLIDSCEVFEVCQGDTVLCGGWSGTVVWPSHNVKGDDNDDSIVISMVHDDGGGGEVCFLFTGDAECEVLEPLAKNGLLPQADVLKVGHHGSKGSVSDYVMAHLGCTLAVASAGKNNLYGHPNAAVVQCVERCGASLLCTKDEGDISLYPIPGGVRVICQNPSA